MCVREKGGFCKSEWALKTKNISTIGSIIDTFQKNHAFLYYNRHFERNLILEIIDYHHVISKTTPDWTVEGQRFIYAQNSTKPTRYLIFDLMN